MTSMTLHNTTDPGSFQLVLFLYIASISRSECQHPSSKQQDREGGRKTQVCRCAIHQERCPEIANPAYISLIQTQLHACTSKEERLGNGIFSREPYALLNLGGTAALENELMDTGDNQLYLAYHPVFPFCLHYSDPCIPVFTLIPGRQHCTQDSYPQVEKTSLRK